MKGHEEWETLQSQQSFSNNVHFNRFVGKTGVFSEREGNE